MTAGPGPDGTGPGAVGQPELESVTGPDGRAEVIGDAGPDDGPPAGERAAAWLRDRARRHPRVTAGVTVLAVTAAMVPVGVAVRDRLDGPEPPAGMRLTLSPAVEDDAWPLGADLRPNRPPVLRARVGVRLPSATGLGLVVTGLTGPGVTQDRAVPERLPAGATGMSVPVSPVLDCDRLPEPSNDPGYRVSVLLTSGGRQVTRSLPVDSRRWAATAQQLCRTWRARRDLTVTALSARVDPVESRLTVTATVRNTGRHPAMVAPAPDSCCGHTVESGGVLPVPAGGSAAADWTVSLSTCDAVAEPIGGAAPLSVDRLVTDEVGLAGLAGPDLPPDLSGSQPPDASFAAQLVPPGIVMDRDAGAALTAALVQACGGLSQPVLLVGPGSVRLSRPAGRVTVDAVLDVSPGKVRSVTLTTDPDVPLAEEYPALWTSIGPLTPDRTGQVPVRLSYEVTGSARGCLPYGGVLPPLTITLEVPEGGRVRTVRYTEMPVLAADPEVEDRLCPGG